jgi:hypothetical protein
LDHSRSSEDLTLPQTVQPPTSPADAKGDTPPPADSPRSAAYWLAQLDSAEKREEGWRKQGDEVLARYMDDRARQGEEKRLNVLWANTDVQKGALFAQLGNPDVRRLFPKPGRDNKIARTAALVIERGLVACVNRYEADCEIEAAVEDHILPGRGVCWLEYDVRVEAVEATGVEAGAGQLVEAQAAAERIVYQTARFCHVDWKDFRHGSGKAWRDVAWVARLMLFTKKEVEERWPDKADRIKTDYVIDEQYLTKERKQGDDFKRAKVWEIWHKPLGIRVHVAEGCDIELDREPDPYRLEGFFPCPKPLYGVKTTSSLTPKPEFLQWKDQSEELDRVNTRIWKLLEKLRYCGVYDASGEDAEALDGIGDLDDGQFKPYKNFRALSEGGGLAQAFQVRDLAPIAATVQSLAQRAVQLIEAIYEITGLSDILRGVSDPQETLGAQELKARSGGTRIDRKRKDVQRFVRELYRMKAELIAEHFERDRLEEMTGIRLPLAADRDRAKAMLQQLEAQQAAQAQALAAQQQAAQQGQQPGQPQQLPAPAMPMAQLAPMDPDELAELKETADAVSWEEISGILRSDDRRNYKIDVETDATSFAETEEEKSQALEFAKVMVELIGASIQAASSVPALLDVSKELIMMVARRFKAGRTIEETLDDAFAQVASQAPQQAQAQPDPMLELRKEELQAKIMAQRAKYVMDEEAAEAKLAAEREQHAMDMELARAKHATAMVAEQTSRRQAENALLAAELEASDPQVRARELDLRATDMEERRKTEAEDRTMRREVETETLKKRSEAKGDAIEGEAFEARRAELEQTVLDGVAAQVQAIAGELTQGMRMLSESQAQVAEALAAIRGEQEETADAMTEIVRHITAPRRVMRDPATGRPAGVETMPNEGDLRELMARLGGPGRPVIRGQDGRVEGIG